MNKVVYFTVAMNLYIKQDADGSYDVSIAREARRAVAAITGVLTNDIVGYLSAENPAHYVAGLINEEIANCAEHEMEDVIDNTNHKIEHYPTSSVIGFTMDCDLHGHDDDYDPADFEPPPFNPTGDPVPCK